MDSCDVVIVGGGPAGSTCAWKLRQAGFDVVVIDRRRFPRDKVCGGWITPAVLAELRINSDEYQRGRVFQPITGFRTSCMGGPEVETHYKAPVSYGIRRCEFDHYLLERSGARLIEEESFERLERSGTSWILNGKICAPLVIGAGGHFCPVARYLGARLGEELIVAAQEVEFLLNESQQAQCAIAPEIPELYFCSDLKGYGWCFRKGNVLNIGLGRLEKHRLSHHVAAFLDFLKRARKVPADTPSSFPGHAYLLYGMANRSILGDAILLIGDAAGLAYWQSGEGIRPAVESGLMAAEAVVAAKGEYRASRLETYRAMLTARFGKAESDWLGRIAQQLPDWFTRALGSRLMATGWFSRHVVLDRWFLHSHQSALQVG